MRNQTNRSGSIGTRRATVGVWVIVLVAGLGLVAGGWIYWRQHRQPVVPEVAPVVPAVVLSETTTKILTSLDGAVEVRWFTPRDVSVLPAALTGYLARVGDLLTEYERVAAGNLHVIKCDPTLDASAKVAAGAAGVAPVATESGEIYYLGLTVSAAARSEAITSLAPEWEAALESDLSRAILRVSTKLPGAVRAQATVQTPAPPAAINPAISEELLRTFPDLAARNYEDLAVNLRQRTLEEFKIASAEMQKKMAEAQKNLAAAQANKGPAAQEAATQELQRVQTEQANKLSAITAQLAERIAVLQQLKAASKLPAPAP